MLKRIFIIFIILVLVFPIIIKADTGSKPSIEVKIKGIGTTNYLVDLFVYDENNENYEKEMDAYDDRLSDEEANMLYNLNFDGWISEGTRWGTYLLFADCKGNSNYTNEFSYFGTPDEYKVVIINKDTNEIKITDKIIREDYNSSIVVDFNNMKVTTSKSIISISIIALIVTIVIELLIALAFKIKKIWVIVLTNFVTNLLLQASLFIINNVTLFIFIGLEVAVIILELLVYSKSLKELAKDKIAKYTLVANIVTSLITFIIK